MYNVSSFMEIINNFRKLYPLFNFTTDIIVGFPGESREDFAQTLRIAKEAAFSHIHTFRYSVRRGTRAERMENQIPEREKASRSVLIREISDNNKLIIILPCLVWSRLFWLKKSFGGSGKGIWRKLHSHSIPRSSCCSK